MMHGFNVYYSELELVLIIFTCTLKICVTGLLVKTPYFEVLTDLLDILTNVSVLQGLTVAILMRMTDYYYNSCFD